MFTRSRAARSSRRCSIEKSLLLLCLLLYVDAATLAFATTALLLIYGRYYDPRAVAVAGGFASALGSATQLLLLRWILAGDKPWRRRLKPSRDKLGPANGSGQRSPPRSVGVDTGGTFTDFVARAGNRIVTFKLPSTPDAPDRAVLAGLERLGAGRATRVRHGSTVATNALLERKGAR